MKKSMKRTLSLLLALTMVLSLGLPAYAVGVPEDDIAISEEPAVKTANLPIGAGKQPGIIEEDEIISDDLIVDIVDEETVDEETAAPAKDFSYNESATGFSVEVSAPVGALPLGTEMVVDRLVDLSAVQAAVDAAENLSGEVQLAADISFWLEGKEIEPAEGTKLLVRMSAPEIEGIADPIIVHIPDGENAVPEIVEQVKPDDDIVMVNTIEFEADSFSTFAVVWSGNGSTSNTTGYVRWYNTNSNQTWASVTVHYVDQNGNPISRPSNIYDTYGDNAYYYDFSGTGTYPVQISDLTGATGAIPGYTFSRAYRMNNGSQTNLTRMDYQYTNSYDRVRFYNGNTNFANQNLSSYNSNAGDIYLVYTGAPTGSNRVTIHYVDTEGKELTVKNSTFPSGDLDASSTSPAFLIYDIDGYTYDHTYRNTDTAANEIRAMLSYNNNTWRYTTSTATYDHNNSEYNYAETPPTGESYYAVIDDYWTMNNGTKRDGYLWIDWSNLNNGDNIYVVYSKMADPVQGGSATVDPTTHEWPSSAPTFGKSSTSNGDGTNTISLTITGPEKKVEDATKANVIVVFDVSGSMRNNMAGTLGDNDRYNDDNNDALYDTASTRADQINANARLSIAAKAVNNMAHILLTKKDGNNNPLVQMALISFSTSATKVQDFTNNETTFTGKVNALTADGGTNWEQALQMANRMQNDDEEFTDAPTFIVFVTDGDPTFRVSRTDITDAQVDTGWLANAVRSDGVYGEGNDDSQSRNFATAVAEVQSVIGHEKSFYAIGVSNAVTKVQNLVTQGNGNADNAFLADNETALTNAFNSIVESITTYLGYGDVEITDGITEMANVDMKVMHEVDPESFQYYRYGGEGNKYGADYAHKTTWSAADMETAKCGPASYDSATGAVQWNMGDEFQLENNVTYVVTFRVWASEEALELVADVNNGIVRDADGNITEQGLTPEEAYNKLSADQKAQIEPVTGSDPVEYTLKTNTDNVKATYKKTTKSGDVVETVSDSFDLNPVYGEIEGLDLPSMELSIKKLFEDDLTGAEDRETEVTLTLLRRAAGTEDEFEPYPVAQSGGVVSANIVLNDDNDWTYKLFVAPGVAVGETQETAEILEAGYEYRLAEPGIDYHYELVDEKVNPMEFNGATVFWGDGNSDRALTGTNQVKGGIDIRKIVTDANGNEIQTDEEFTIKGWILDPDGQPYTWTDGDNVNNSGAYHKYDQQGNRVIYKGHFPSTADITLTLKVGEYYRFINVPTGSTYCFYEVDENGQPVEGVVMPGGFEFWKIVGQNQQRDPAPKDENGDPIYDDEGKIVVGDFHLIDEQPTIENNKITGQVYANTQHNVVFYNKSVLHGDFFYVYHSSDNTVEKIYADDTRVIKGKLNAETGSYSYIFNIAAETKAGFIYGGYYQSYNGNEVTVSGDGALTFEVKPYSFKTALAYVTDPNLGGTWADDDAGQPYMGNGEWWANDTAYTENGMAFEPEMNTVYYLKEVPEAYLRGMIRYTYYDDPGNKYPIGTLWLVCALDGSYKEFGVSKLDKQTDKFVTGEITDLFTVTPLNNTSNKVNYNAESFLRQYNETHKDKPDYKDGKVGFIKVYDKRSIDPIESATIKIDEGENLCLYWITPDGVTVTGTRQFSVTNIFKGSGKKIEGVPYITLNKADVVSTLTEPAATGSGT